MGQGKQTSSFELAIQSALILRCLRRSVNILLLKMESGNVAIKPSLLRYRSISFERQTAFWQVHFQLYFSWCRQIFLHVLCMLSLYVSGTKITFVVHSEVYVLSWAKMTEYESFLPLLAAAEDNIFL